MADKTLDDPSFTLVSSIGLNDTLPIMVGGVQHQLDGEVLFKSMHAPIAEGNFNDLIVDYPAADWEGYYAKALDVGIGGGTLIYSDGVSWLIQIQSAIVQSGHKTGTILFGSSGATYSQTGTLITVTKASHGIPNDAMLNGQDIHISFSTGLAITGIYTDFQYIDANSFSCVSGTSQSTSGNCLSNTSETFISENFEAPDWRMAYLQGGTQYITRGTSSTHSKTFRAYFSGIRAVADQVQTTAPAGFGTLTTAVLWLSPTTFIVVGQTGVGVTGNGVTNTEVNNLFTASMQLANGGEWAFMKPYFQTINVR